MDELLAKASVLADGIVFIGKPMEKLLQILSSSTTEVSLFLNAMLSKRKINPEINFIDNYISEDTFYHFSL